MAVTSFIPELWDARLLYNLEKAHVATKLVNRNYEGEIKGQGDTVRINSIGAVTVSDYTRNTNLSDPEVLSTSDQTLLIDQAKSFNFVVDDIDKVQAKGELVDVAMGRASYALADVADKYLFDIIANGVDSGNIVGSKTAPVALTSANVYENIVKLRTKLDKQNVSTQGRSLVVNPDAYALLLNDTTHFAVASDKTGDDVVINGLVGRIAGFDVYMSNNVVEKSDGGADGKTNYYILTAQVPDATTYAEQIIETEAYRPEKRFADAVKGLHVYGAKVTNGKEISALYCTIA